MLPVLLILLFGIIDVGRLVYINNALAEAAREGARWGSVAGRSNVPDAIQNHTTAMIAAVPGPTVVVECRVATPSAPVVTTCHPGNILSVTVSSDVTMFTPVIGSIVGPREISATSEMVVNE